MREKPDRIAAEYALNEVGGFTMTMGASSFYPVQVAEKGICWLRIRALGEPGHGSLPNRENPLIKIGRAAERLGTRRLPFHKTPVVERFIHELAEQLPGVRGRVLKLLLRPGMSDFVLDRLFPDPSLAASFEAALHNTANPTIVRGGRKINVVPPHADLEVDGRILPGQTPEAFVEEVRALLGAGYQIEIEQAWPATVSDIEDPILETFRRVIERHSGGKGIMLPYMIPGFTDSAHYSRLGIKCFGFSPVRLGPEDRFAKLYHGHDERIPVEGFWWGLRVLIETVVALTE
ncbi:MAG: M20/M25/M40 family metallo-hydrolase [Deltaproteobacteria bacterium]|nr:MAG: M20/M25/M40 family metallo-hydrolase [Deltaproteobacteria bacterium]